MKKEFKRRIITAAQFHEEAKKRFGDDPFQWKLVCPACGTVQCGEDLLKAGVTKEKLESYIGFACIGRFTGQGDKGIAAHNKGKPWTKGCNWTLGGLFQIHELEVVIDGKNRPAFELAES